MAEAPEFFFALFNCPETHDIRVENGEISAVGDKYNLAAERLKMDLVNGYWVNQLGVAVDKLIIPPAWAHQ